MSRYWGKDVIIGNSILAQGDESSTFIIQGCLHQSVGNKGALHCPNCCEKIASIQQKKRDIEATNEPIFYQGMPSYWKEKIVALEESVQSLRTQLHQSLKQEKKEEPNELVAKLELLLKNKPRYAETFNYRFLLKQVECASRDSARGNRWGQEMLDFADTIAFLGGARTLDFLRGKATQGLGGQGSLPNSIEDHNLYLPAESTLQSHHQNIDVYPTLDFSDLKLQLSLSACIGGLHFDEIDIREGLAFGPNNTLIGTTLNGIKEKDVLTFYDENKGKIPSKIANRVFQIFYVALDGSACIPIHYIPSRDLSAEKAFSYIKSIVDEAAKHKIQIKWTSSDLFSGFASYLELMKAEYGDWMHFLDMSHVIKCIRNSGLGSEWKNPDCSEGFSIRDLVTLWFSDEQLRKKIKLRRIWPVDKQDMESPKLLFELIPALKDSSNTKIQALAKLLQHLSNYYECWSDGTKAASEKLDQIKQFIDYLEKWKLKNGTENFISHQSFSAIKVTHASLIKFKAFFESTLQIPLNNFCFLDTLIVENFFSMIRSKVRYPNLWQYSCIHSAAWRELVKKFASDCSYSQRSGKIGQKYPNQKGLKFTMSMVNGITPMEKAKSHERQNNRGKFLKPR